MPEWRMRMLDDRNESFHEAALFRLMTWLSPNYPTGAFGYSHGLEFAAEAGLVRGDAEFGDWISQTLVRGAGRVDAGLFVAAWRAAAENDLAKLDETAELAAAWRGTAEIELESNTQGGAFLTITETAWPAPLVTAFKARRNERPTALPVAVGLCAAAHWVPLRLATVAFLHGMAASLISAGVRLGIAGQTTAQRIMASLEGAIAGTATQAMTTPLEEVGAATPIGDWCSMRHETQYTRLFRS